MIKGSSGHDSTADVLLILHPEEFCHCFAGGVRVVRAQRTVLAQRRGARGVYLRRTHVQNSRRRRQIHRCFQNVERAEDIHFVCQTWRLPRELDRRNRRQVVDMIRPEVMDGGADIVRIADVHFIALYLPQVATSTGRKHRKSRGPRLEK